MRRTISIAPAQFQEDKYVRTRTRFAIGAHHCLLATLQTHRGTNAALNLSTILTQSRVAET